MRRKSAKFQPGLNECIVTTGCKLNIYDVGVEVRAENYDGFALVTWT